VRSHIKPGGILEVLRSPISVRCSCICSGFPFSPRSSLCFCLFTARVKILFPHELHPLPPLYRLFLHFSTTFRLPRIDHSSTGFCETMIFYTFLLLTFAGLSEWTRTPIFFIFCGLVYMRPNPATFLFLGPPRCPLINPPFLLNNPFTENGSFTESPRPQKFIFLYSFFPPSIPLGGLRYKVAFFYPLKVYMVFLPWSFCQPLFAPHIFLLCRIDSTEPLFPFSTLHHPPPHPSLRLMIVFSSLPAQSYRKRNVASLFEWTPQQ